MHERIALLGIEDAEVNCHNDRNGMEAAAAVLRLHAHLIFEAVSIIARFHSAADNIGKLCLVRGSS